MRIFRTFPLVDEEIFQKQMLNWANQFNICSFLDDQQYGHSPHYQKKLLAVDQLDSLTTSGTGLSDDLRAFLDRHNDWCFFHLCFDALTEDVAPYSLNYSDPIGFPPAFFFIPRYVLTISEGCLTIGSCSNDHDEVYRSIAEDSFIFHQKPTVVPPLRHRLTKDQYLQKLEGLLAHIHRGDCYEINFCQDFYIERASIDPLTVWRKLCAISPNPFSAYYRLNESYLLCASPERFLTRKGTQLLSQPIKGTIHRDLLDQEKDDLLRKQLLESDKDRAENVMVVDLVRNDLSKVCREGSVRVKELFGIYAFPQVYQMISTIEGELRPDKDLADILTACFPMGSMTGAPKYRVLELIRLFEECPRGLFSGTVGYLTPEGNFDMNVVIRSLLYNEKTGYLSFFTGSGITAASIPEQEYEECLLKGKAIRQVLAE